ncbi:MAG: glycerol-3-phosphate dehydrogenase [Thermoplasmata archaeon]|jgi:glycerol-3-phosphate dehydrogenase|nr:glycerol-3-phosphate dehydrogenase [Thermoplasmata archaeon]
MPPLPRRLDALEGRTFDLLVVGGGINGAGVARDAARRGLSVALVEKEDFGYGTTGRSTRLIHGGLRYLAMYDFGLVRESLVERERLFHNAPHLVHPLLFLIPFYRGQRTPPWMVKMGLRLYDALAGKSVVPSHQVYGKDELLALEPGLNAEGLRGGASYGDGQVELVERLCVENVLDAIDHGAVALNHCSLASLTRGPPFLAEVHDAISGRSATLRARRVVNATGPWLHRVPGAPDARSRMTKGTHIVTPRATTHAILLFSPDDDRVFFSIPWLDHQLVGTTDTDFDDDPDEVAADRDDVTYLQRGIRSALPRADVETVRYTWAGVRNLIFEEGKTESEVSRKHQILEDDGLVTLVGGKITPYRQVCEEVVDRVAPRTHSDTARAPLPGAPPALEPLVKALEDRAAELRLPPGVARTLATTYGTRAGDVLDRVARDPAQGRVLCPHAPMLAAEADHAIECEMARAAADVLLRRTRCGWEACQGLDALPVVLDRLDAMLGRNAKEREADEARYREQVALRGKWRVP